MKASWHLQPPWQRVLLWWSHAIKPRGKLGIHFCRCYWSQKGVGGMQHCRMHCESMPWDKRRGLWVLPGEVVVVFPTVGGCSEKILPAELLLWNLIHLTARQRLRWGHLPASALTLPRQDSTASLIQMVPQKSILKGNHLQRVQKPKL